MSLKLKNIVLLLLFLLQTNFLFAQTPYVLQDVNVTTVENFEVLPDNNYTFKQILEDSSLQFVANPQLLEKEYIKGHDYFWIRFFIKNNSTYNKKIYLTAVPLFDNEIYNYDTEEKEWKTQQGGFEVIDYQRREGFKPVLISTKKIDTIFIKVKISPLKEQYNASKFKIYIQKGNYYENKEILISTIWVVTSITMLLFFLYNLYVYFIFRDKTYLYYLIIVVGGLIYITSFLDYFNVILPLKTYSLDVMNNCTICIFDINLLFIHISIYLVLFGFVKFTSSYLKLFAFFPRWNKMLHYAIYFYGAFITLILALTLSKVYFAHSDTVILFLNLFIVGIILSLLIVGILSLIHGYKPARYFLLANGIPLLLMLVLTLFLLRNSQDTQSTLFLPSAALLTQTLAFAIALVARINLIKDELKEKQHLANQLELENEKMLARNRYIELENEHIIADIVQEVNTSANLKQKLESNQRELTANTLYLYQKNEMLSNLQNQIKNLSFKNATEQNKEGIKEIKLTIKNDLYLENDWDKFKLHFEEVHPDFFIDLKEKYPALTQNEIRLSAYYHLNMSAKEIATLLNINPTSVHRAKSRLNKKMEKIKQEN